MDRFEKAFEIIDNSSSEECKEILKEIITYEQCIEVICRKEDDYIKKGYEYLDYLTDNQIINVFNKLGKSAIILPNTADAVKHIAEIYDVDFDEISKILYIDDEEEEKMGYYKCDKYLIYYQDDNKIESLTEDAIEDGYKEFLIDNMNYKTVEKIVDEYRRTDDVIDIPMW